MGISKDLIEIICREKKSIIKNFSWRDTFKRNVKIMIIFLLEYLPFSWEMVFFSYIRGENINKINL